MKKTPVTDISQEFSAGNIAVMNKESATALGSYIPATNPDLSRYLVNPETITLAKKLIILDEQQRVKPRDRGLKQALEFYTNKLALKQPKLYSICLKAAQDLLQQNPYNKIPRMLYCLSAHSSEERLIQLIDRIAEQNILKDELSIYILLNGNNITEIQAKQKELEESNLKHPELDLRIITTLVPVPWQMGFKTLAITTAMLAIKESLDQLKIIDHPDMVLAFADADILSYANNNLLQERSQRIIEKGMLIDFGPYKQISKVMAGDTNNINAQIIFELHKSARNLQDQQRSQIAKNTDSKIAKVRYLLIGANSACSMILAALVGGMPFHNVLYEDMSLSSTTAALLKKLMPDLNQNNLCDRGLAPKPSQDNFVITDAGAELRALKQNLPIGRAFMSHHPQANQQELSPIDWDSPKSLNVTRLHQEMVESLRHYLNSLALSKDDNLSSFWSEELSKLIKEYIEQLEPKLNAALEQFKITDKLSLQLTVTDLPNIKVSLGNNSIDVGLDIELLEKTFTSQLFAKLIKGFRFGKDSLTTIKAKIDPNEYQVTEVYGTTAPWVYFPHSYLLVSKSSIPAMPTTIPDNTYILDPILGVVQHSSNPKHGFTISSQTDTTLNFLGHMKDYLPLTRTEDCNKIICLKDNKLYGYDPILNQGDYLDPSEYPDELKQLANM